MNKLSQQEKGIDLSAARKVFDGLCRKHSQLDQYLEIGFSKLPQFENTVLKSLKKVSLHNAERVFLPNNVS